MLQGTYFTSKWVGKGIKMKISGLVSKLPAMLAALTFMLIMNGCDSTKPDYPETRVSIVRDTLQNTVVADPYRWLENWADPEVKAWSEAQNQTARKFLDHIPFDEALSRRISAIMKAAPASYYDMAWQGGKLFALKNQPPLNQPLLVWMTSADEAAAERIIVNPNQLDTASTTSMDWYVPSPDGKLVAVSLSYQGSESGTLTLFDTESGRQTDVVIPKVNGGTAGGDMAWAADGSGFYYTRYPREGERSAEDMNFYQQVWYHRLGTSVDADHYVIGKDFPRIAEIQLETDCETGQILLTLQYGDSGRFSIFIIKADGSWKKLSDFEDGIVQAVFGSRRNLFLISREDAPQGKILKLSLDHPSLARSQVLIPESDAAIVSTFDGKSKFVVTPTRLYVTCQLGGPSEIRSFDYEGNTLAAPESLPVSTINEITALNGDDILFGNSSFNSPKEWRRFTAASGETKSAKLKYESPVDFTDTKVLREFAVSRDGTKIPVNIMMKKGTKKDGSNPLLLYGYGGFDISITPGFSAVRKVWIEQGCIWASANIRGGGEYGEAWHRDGALLKKQNCFDDFAAVMQYLIDEGYTTSEKLAIQGGSNGGLLMGAIITQHPELFQTAVSSVGIYDMLRNELTANGQFNIPEYGTVKDADQFRALYAYSPYHHVRAATSYPAILFMTGANDPRVDPMHSRKMTAALQAATTSDNPVLLRTSSTTGHGIGTPLEESILQTVDIYAFIFRTLGIDYIPVN